MNLIGFKLKLPALLTIVFFSVSSSGCFVSKGMVPDVAEELTKEGAFDSLVNSVDLDVELRHYGLGKEANAKNTERRAKEFRKVSASVIEKSGMFANSGYDVNNADLKIRFEVNETEKGSETSAVLTGVTFLLVPAKTGAFFNVVAKIYNNSGQQIAEYQSEGDFNVILQLLFIIPIGWRFSIPNKVYESIVQDILVKMDADRHALSQGKRVSGDAGVFSNRSILNMPRQEAGAPVTVV